MEGLGGAEGPQQEALQAFCRQILAECMGQEKAAMLQPYLFFQTLVQLYSSTCIKGEALLDQLLLPFPSLTHCLSTPACVCFAENALGEHDCVLSAAFCRCPR